MNRRKGTLTTIPSRKHPGIALRQWVICLAKFISRRGRKVAMLAMASSVTVFMLIWITLMPMMMTMMVTMMVTMMMLVTSVLRGTL